VLNPFSSAQRKSRGGEIAEKKFEILFFLLPSAYSAPLPRASASALMEFKKRENYDSEC
jgi:hypothetical protein